MAAETVAGKKTMAAGISRPEPQRPTAIVASLVDPSLGEEGVRERHPDYSGRGLIARWTMVEAIGGSNEAAVDEAKPWHAACHAYPR